MQKKSTSQSAFVNLRVVVGFSIFLLGVFLALVGVANPSLHFADEQGEIADRIDRGPNHHEIATYFLEHRMNDSTSEIAQTAVCKYPQTTENKLATYSISAVI
jgi:hypothetical protein